MDSPRCPILRCKGDRDQVKQLKVAGGWSRRQVLVALCFLASFIAYTDRVNISVAAVAMQEDLGWSQTQKGLVLSSFFVGYMLFMYASGALAKRYGGRNVLGWAVVAWSAFTLLTPVAAAVSIPLLIATRILMGVGEAAIFPASVELYSRWIPVTERTRAMARLLSGVPMGTVVGLMATGWIVGRWHWSMAFIAGPAAGGCGSRGSRMILQATAASPNRSAKCWTGCSRNRARATRCRSATSCACRPSGRWSRGNSPPHGLSTC